MNTKTSLNMSVVLFALIAAAFTTGCKDSRRHQSTDALAVPTSAPALAQNASPKDVTIRFLETARKVQHIRESGFAEPERQKTYDEEMAALQALVNGPQLHKNMMMSQSANHLPAGMTEEAAVTTATESWLSIVAHYVDGMQLDSSRLTAGGKPDALNAVVHIQGENPDEVAAIKELEASPEIREAKDADGKPIASGTPAYYDLVRTKALELDPPVTLPLRATFVVTLARAAEDAPWGIVSIRIGQTLQAPKPASTASEQTTLPIR